MLFDSTLRRDLSRAFGATLVVLVTIVITMMLMRTLGQAAGGVVDPRDVMLLLGYATLGYMPTILSLALFITIVATLTRMYRDSEMVIWFASGLGLARFVRPVLGMSWPVLLIVLLLALFVWPWVNQRVAELKYRYETRSDLSRVAAGQFQSSADGRRVFFIERDPEDLRIGRNVFVLIRKGDTESVTSAREGRVDFEGDQQNTIACLISEDPAAAERVVERLAELLRYCLTDLDRTVVPLRDELSVVRAYLEVQAARFGSRLRFVIDCPDALGNQRVPPLCLQPLVENAVLHGAVASRRGGLVTVQVAIAEPQLLLSVQDDGPGLGKSTHQGSGGALRGLRERLRILYPDADPPARLDLMTPADGLGCLVELRLPLDA